MLGAGHRPATRILVGPTSAREENTTWVRLDVNEAAKPDVVFDLNNVQHIPLPFDKWAFDEIHAYEVLEHVGRQGDWRQFFAEFREYHRVLKPGGLLFGTSPSLHSRWVWGDPSHTRVICEESLSFLVRDFYEQLGKTPASDFRAEVDPHWWNYVYGLDDGKTYAFGLQKV